MQHSRSTTWAAILMVAVLVLAGCAPRAGGGVFTTPGAEKLAVDLPALLIDFDDAGQPSVGNVPVAQLASQFAPGMLDSLVLSPDLVQYMVESNIQHLQISNSPQGLILQVNGRSLPSLRWDGQILEDTAGAIDLLGAELGAGVALVEKLLPLIAHVGIGVIARFPVAEGVAQIPLYTTEDPEAALAAKQIQDDFLATVDTTPTITVPVFYDAQGNWRVGDLTDAEWINLTGLAVFDSFRMQPTAVNQLMQQGISQLSISTDASGIHVRINGHSLPYIGWADGELNNVLDLAEQMGLWNTLADRNMNTGEIVAMIEQLLPIVQTSEVTITAHFPDMGLAAAP